MGNEYRDKKLKGSVKMVKPVKKELDVFVTVDDKVFLTEDEAIKHENSLNTKYVLVNYAPELTEQGRFQKTGIVEVVDGQGREKEYALDACFKNLGSALAYVQGVAATPNWEIVKVLTIDEYRNLKESNNKLNVIAHCENPRMWRG